MTTRLRSYSASVLLLALLTLLGVSGPHLVHHLPDVAPSHHDHDHAPPDHETPAPTPPPCPVLFFVQHSTAVATWLAWTPVLLPALALPLLPHALWATVLPETPLHARAPPLLA